MSSLTENATNCFYVILLFCLTLLHWGHGGRGKEGESSAREPEPCSVPFVLRRDSCRGLCGCNQAAVVGLRGWQSNLHLHPQQGCSSPVAAVVREEENGSTEDLVATTGTAELSVVWTGLSSSPASLQSGAGSAAVTSRSNEVARLNQGGGSSYSQQCQEAEKSKSGQIAVVHCEDERF